MVLKRDTLNYEKAQGRPEHFFASLQGKDLLEFGTVQMYGLPISQKRIL